MKYKKIFTFILLLCTIFSTLLIVNPNVKAETTPPSDLTGYIVTIPSNWSKQNISEGYYYIEGNVTFYGIASFTEPFSSIRFYTSDSEFKISIGSQVLNFYGSNYSFSLEITGGIDTTNQNLIQWFVDNDATFTLSEEPEPAPTYTLNGGFKFNTIFASSDFYSTDIVIDFTNYFPFPYNSGYSSFVNFSSITFQQRDDTQAGVMYYRSEYGLTTAWTDVLINGLGFWNNYNNPALITQFIKFNNVVVSEDIYNWLNSVGTFGDFDYTDIPDDSTGDTPNTSRFQWLINDIDAFMNLEPLPNLSFYDILLVFVSVPLLIYILKLFLGG